MVSKMCRKVNDRYPKIFCRHRSPTGTVLRRGYVEPDMEFRISFLIALLQTTTKSTTKQQQPPTQQPNQQQHETTTTNKSTTTTTDTTTKQQQQPTQQPNNNNNQHNNETTVGLRQKCRHSEAEKYWHSEPQLGRYREHTTCQGFGWFKYPSDSEEHTRNISQYE